MSGRSGFLSLSTLFLIRGCSAIYSSALPVLSLQTAVVGLILMPGLGVHLPQEKVGRWYLSLSAVGSALTAVSGQTGILGGTSVLRYLPKYMENMKKGAEQHFPFCLCLPVVVLVDRTVLVQSPFFSGCGSKISIGFCLFSCRSMELIRRRNWRLLLAFVFL